MYPIEYTKVRNIWEIDPNSTRERRSRDEQRKGKIEGERERKGERE